MKRLKLRIITVLALLLCAAAVACQTDMSRPPAKDTATTQTTPSPFLPDGFRWDFYENKVEDIVRARLQTAAEDEWINIEIAYPGPTEEEIQTVIEERWQIMKDIQSGSIPSQETTYTLPREGDGIRNRIALERDVAREMHLQKAYAITDEFFPDTSQIIYISHYTPRITVRATPEQIRALSQSPLISYIRDYDSRTTTTTY